jgi:acetyl-CoA synthetase
LEFIIESAAISVAPKGGGPENLIIYFVPQYKIDYSTALSELSQKIKNEINPLFKVVDVVSIDTLPRTSSGKVMRRTLRKWYVKG